MVIRHINDGEEKLAAELERQALSVPWSEKSIKEFFSDKNNLYLVCENEGEIVGICGGMICTDQCDITNIAVKEEYRRHGMGNAMISELLTELKRREVTKVFLEVAENNINAIKLYEKYNFHTIGRRRNYYKNCDALLMISEEF